MPDAKRLIRDFQDGRSAARNDRPRSVCNLRPSQTERWDAWHAGYDYEAAGGYILADAIPAAFSATKEN